MSTEEILKALSLEKIEADVRSYYKVEGSFGKNVRVEKIGSGQGFVSEVLLFYPDWTEEGKVPEYFAIKFLSARANGSSKFDEVLVSSEPSGAEILRAKLHNTEVEVLKWLSKCSDLPVTKIISANEMVAGKGPGYFLMKHIKGSPNLHMCDNISESALNQVMRTLAKIQVIGMDVPEEVVAQNSRDYFNSIAKIIYEDKTVENFCRMLEKTASPIWPESTSELIKRFKPIAPNFLRFSDDVGSSLKMKKVLCHGDVWMCNMLWNAEDAASWKLEALIDFQAAHFGCPGIDLVRLFCGVLSGEERRARANEYIERFYEFLREELGDDSRLPYSLEQLRESYHRQFALAAFIVCGSIAVVGEMIVEKSDDPKVAKEVLFEKQKCLIEDIVKEMDRSLTIMHSEQKQ
ncbi:unnamed protein product [Caenorhabditis auriculariae]|uniref:CHK kinase-like domain-containing protein n=1 Tax=Caenorhabditis auriculariae TaxID=2777116 RepID=A0A8S1HTU4_9PELO|nr:unnamed protein product [Caenorhabditis auriculariae]